MNKSKFLKKSLALLLAFMLVFAMIPLGAAAAEYKPTGTVKPALVDPTSGTLTGSGNTWNVDFKYSADLPALKVEYNVAGDTVKVIKADGSEASLSADTTGMQVELKDGESFPFQFVIENSNGDRSEVYTVTWTMPEPSATGKATSAKLDGKYDGEIDETEKTITFTVPFGYGAAGAGNSLEYVISYEGCKKDSITKTFAKTVGTNMKNTVGELVDNETQDGNNEVDYTVIIKEEAGLTSFKIGDFETEFVISTAGNDGVTDNGTYNAACDIGCQTGMINVYIPADLAADANGKLMLTPTFTVDPTNHTKVEIQNNTNTSPGTTTYGTLKSGEEFDFAYLLRSDTYWNYVNAGAPIKITNTEEVDSTRLYVLKFVRDVTDTTIDSFTADGVDGIVNGTNLDVEISPSTSLSSVNLEFVGPKQPSGGTAPTIQVVNLNGSNVGSPANFSAAGEATLSSVDCSKPVYLKVISSDTNKQQIYTLTVKHAAQDTLDPKVLTAKLILNYNTVNETTHIGTVDEAKQVITFSDIPYSTTDADLATSVPTTIYSFSKTPLTNLVQDADGKKVTVTAAGTSQSKNYEVKFEKAAARTGKSISDFILTEATNINLVGYNNLKTYDVKATVKANDESTFEVTVPAANTTDTYFADFTLDGGAKMYSLNGVGDGKLTGKEVTVNFNADTGAQQGTAQFIVGQKYLIADEKLATAIAADGADVATFTQLKNNYPSNYTIYTMTEKTYTRKNNAILTAISADDGLVKGEVVNVPNNDVAVKNRGKITLTVPYSYVTTGNEKTFYFDYTVSEGANLNLIDSDGTNRSALISGGKVTYNIATGKIEAVPATPWPTWGDDYNPHFKVKVDGGVAKLYVVHNSGDTKIDTTTYGLAVLAEDGTTYGYYTIKEVKVADPIKDDKLSTVKANSTNATVDNSAKTVKVSLPFGTNLGQVKLDIVPSSKLAEVEILNASGTAVAFDSSATYDLSYARKIKVTADSGDYSTYTLTATLGTMFSDVPESAWYYQYVLDAANKGLVTGYEDGTFKPMNNITRGDFALIVTRMLGVDEDDLEYVTTPFSDVNDKTYNAKAISYCAENGFISGYEDGTFKPTKNISRQEAAKVLATALSLNGTTAEKFKDDASIASWASGYVYACKAAGIIDGDNKGNFNPKKMITRAETAKLMVEALNNK